MAPHVQIFLFFTLLGHTSCDISHADVTKSSVWTEVTEMESNDTRNDIFPNSPDRLVAFIDKELSFDLEFNISCQYGKNDLILRFQSKHTSIFRVAENDGVEILCPSTNNDHSLDSIGTSSDHDSEPVSRSNGTVRIHLTGNKLGVADLIVSLHFATSRLVYTPEQNISERPLAEQTIPVVVLRNIRVIDKVFLGVVPIFIVVVMIGFGCKLDLEVVKECIKKPLAPGIGFGCQYLIMPLIGFTVAYLVPTGDKGISLGIFLCGICPGGGISNIYTYLLDGDVSLSITMTFVSTVASIGMMPLWLYTLGRVFTDSSTHLTVPYIDLLMITAMVTVPLLVGIFLKYKCHKVAMAFIKVLKPLTFVMVIVIVSFGIYSNLYIFKMFQPIHLIAGCLLPYCGYVLGGVVAALFRLPWTRVKTIAIETGLQNQGVAFILLMKSFPPPYGDIAAIAPAASSMMSPLPLLLISIVYQIYKRCTRKYKKVEQKTDAEKNGLQNETKEGNIVLTEKLSTV